MTHALLTSFLVTWTAALAPPECDAETAVEPGRWLVESTCVGEEPAVGRAEIVRLGQGCLFLERLVLHLPDGSSHHVVYVQGHDLSTGDQTLLQIGDHPLFLVWDDTGTEAGEHYQTVRSTSRGEVELQWRATASEGGFTRRLMVRGPGEDEWTLSETMTYEPLSAVEDPGELPSHVPGPFHDPDACQSGGFRGMDYLLGHWFNEEWERADDGTWSPASVSEVNVESVVAGCALIETHPIYEDGELSDRLLLVRGYQADVGRWRQMVFGYNGGVWEWAIEEMGDGWLLTPEAGDAAGRLRILERPTADGLTKTVEVLRGDDAWQPQRMICYVRW